MAGIPENSQHDFGGLDGDKKRHFCRNNCGTWYGPNLEYGAPEGIDPKGECPCAAPVMAKRIRSLESALAALTERVDEIEPLADELRRY